MSFSQSRPLATSSPNLCRRRLSFNTEGAMENEVTNQLEYLQMNQMDSERNSPSPILAPINNYGGVRMVLEDSLVEQLKQLIDAFLSMHIEQQHQPLTPSSNSIIRWTINHGNEINYSVVITINQPTTHIV